MCDVPHLPALTNTVAALPALHSLSEVDVRELEEGLISLPGIWEMHRQEDYEGDLTLVITAAATASDLVFAVWRCGTNLQLSAMQGDDELANRVLGSTEAVLRAIGDLTPFDKTPAVFRALARLRLV